MRKIFLSILFFTALTWVSLDAKPPKLPKPKKDGEWVEPVKPAAVKSIYGKWIWIETDCCGIRHGISTPESTGDIIEFEVNSDNTFLEVHTKKNTLPRGGNFILFRENQMDMIQFNDERPAQYFLSENGDTMTISWKYLELQTEKYIRKK